MDVEDQQISTTSETGKGEPETELNRARAHSARMRQKVCDTTTGLEQRLDILEENVKSLPELLREKDGDKAMKTRVKKTLETIFKQMKESIENVMKAVEAEEMELLRKEREQMDDREKTPEERKKSIKISTDCNNNVVVNETANCENELTADRTPNALEPNNSTLLSLDRQGKVGFIDRATSPLLTPTQSKSGVNCGRPTNDELELLGSDIASDWIKLGRRLGIGDPMLEEIAKAHEQLSEKGYHMLKSWKQIKGADATYQALRDALQHQLVQRQDLVEKHCYINGKEAVEIELHRARVHSARMRQIVSDKTTGLEERLKTLEEQVKNLIESTREKDCNKTMETRVQEILETTFKQLKESIENIMKEVELEETEFSRKERDQMDDGEKAPEERKKLIEKSSDCNNDVVLKGTASCENELAADGTRNALESDDSPSSLDRQGNLGFLVEVTPLLNPMQSKPEGKNQTCSETNGRLDPGKRVQKPIGPSAEVNGQEQTIAKLKEEKDTVKKELDCYTRRLAQAQRKSGLLTLKNNDLSKKIKKLEKWNEKLETENENLRMGIKTEECDTSTCTELEKLRKENESLKKKNESLKKKSENSLQKIEDLEQKNDNYLSKIKTETSECDKLKAQCKELSVEKERLAKANEKSRQLIKDLKTKNNSLESEVKTKECEIKRFREERDNIAKEKADSIQKMEGLEEKIKALEKNDRYRVLLPSGKHFQSPGAIHTIENDGLANVVATRSSEGPGNADAVINCRLGNEVNCGTRELQGSWWCVDLGKNYLLFPTQYSLRHGKKERSSILRHWQLKGSIDEKNWKDIRTHRRKEEFTDPNPYPSDTWSVEGEVGAFRYFKIVQTGLHSSNWFGIYLSGMEFYGVLLKV